MKKILTTCVLTIGIISTTQAQQNINGFIDYQTLEMDLTSGIQKAVTHQQFTTIQQLRYRAQLLPETSKPYFTPEKPHRSPMPPSAMVAARKPSVLILAKYVAGEGYNPPSAFVWASAIVLTANGICASNYHVFYDLINRRAWPAKNDSLLYAIDSDGSYYSIDSILAYNQTADAVLFKINPNGKKLTPMPIAAKDVEVGERVHAVTNPKGQLYYYTSGVVSRKSAYTPEGFWGNRVEITADFARGSSGGPIMDDKGNLVAMVSATNSVYSRDNPAQGNLQMVVKKTVPISTILQLRKVELAK